MGAVRKSLHKARMDIVDTIARRDAAAPSISSATIPQSHQTVPVLPGAKDAQGDRPGLTTVLILLAGGQTSASATASGDELG